MTVLDYQTTLVVTGAALIGAALIAALAAWCWRGWLDLKRAELGGDRPLMARRDEGPSPMNRIEVADLKERVRRLEAIAAGVDL